jgi:asparagine synthase (glutamine-hydrolysing)
MCGIAGIVGKSATEVLIDKMLLIQKHRGPDFTGKHIESEVAFGHNRLSIIDLSPQGNQPFYSKDKRYILVYNGEIYNYPELRESLKKNFDFKTASDTEVLLAAYINWGKACLSKLNGMFSFAIWDSKKKELFAARDRFGVKPFYYTLKNDSFYFASEIKTLFAAGVPKKTNDSIWAGYFAFGSYGMPNETFWEGIEQLPGGHYLSYINGRVVIDRWYVFEDEIKKHQNVLSFDEVKKTYKELLEDSIKLRFRSDVPVGFNVSGGLDSSTLLALVNRNEKGEKINAYTFYTGDPNYDELPWVEELLENTQNPLSKILLSASEVKDQSVKMSGFQDEPFGGIPTIAYGKIFQQAREDKVIVLLDGQGMDEQWAGYDYYVKKNDSVIQGVKKSPFRKEVLSHEFLNKAVKPIYPNPFEDAILNLQFRDLFYTKIPRALRFNDRISMAASTELREPFLDYRLVEFAFAQPLDYKIKDGIQKYLLRSLVSELLSDTIRYAPKRPLQTPQREWLASDLRPWVETEIKAISAYKWFDKEGLEKELNAYFAGDQDSSFHIWQWLNTGLLLND